MVFIFLLIMKYFQIQHPTLKTHTHTHTSPRIQDNRKESFSSILREHAILGHGTPEQHRVGCNFHGSSSYDGSSNYHGTTYNDLKK